MPHQLLQLGCGGHYLKYLYHILGYSIKKRDADFYDQPKCNELCGSVEDCFNLPCPRYGFVVRYTFTQYVKEFWNQSIENHYGAPEYIEGPIYYDEDEDDIRARQTGEGFRSVAPPDCRITAG